MNQQMTETFNVAMAGLPAAGKSTFLVALYIAMMEKQSGLALGSYSDDREYMNDLSSHTYAAEVVGRTRADSRSSLSLSVQTPSGRLGRLVVPDRSGEIWEQLVVDRVWESTLLASTADIVGYCIFINAETYRHDPDIRSVAQLDDLYPAPPNADAPPEALNHPDQIKITDLFQILMERPERTSRRVSVILSAFDAVSGLSPAQWLSENVPLLEQYLRTNTSTIESRVFGVSAQGGKYDDAAELAVIEAIEPSKRAWAKQADGTDCTIDSPMLWALTEI
jgi:hypothetical protein